MDIVSIILPSSARASSAGDLESQWYGLSAIQISAPSPTSIHQSKANAEAQSHTLVITPDTSEVQTAAGASSYPYTILEETETTLTIQTALSSSTGTTEHPLLINWIDADTIQLRLGNAPYEIVFTRAP